MTCYAAPSPSTARTYKPLSSKPSATCSSAWRSSESLHSRAARSCRPPSGHEERADVLIGADGLGSVVRGTVAETQPRYAGYTAWRGVSTVALEPGRLTESWGLGERFGLVDIGGGRTYWFATKNAPEGETDEPTGRKAELQRRFEDWHPPIRDVLAAADDDDRILRNDVYDLPRLPRWSSGRIVLLGDAAHAATPGVGQGAAEALEDAVVLSGLLAQGADVERALNDYEARRRPRVELVQKMSRRADKAAQLASPLGCRLRNAVIRRLPERVQRRQLEALVRHGL
jgi:2-polyprenyl-6-methoxyphenol hydroxylase-like FAD-dependent oxidoreductase